MFSTISAIILLLVLPMSRSLCPLEGNTKVRLCPVCSSNHAAVWWNASTSSTIFQLKFEYHCYTPEGYEIPNRGSCYSGGNQLGLGGTPQYIGWEEGATAVGRFHAIDGEFQAGVECTFTGHYYGGDFRRRILPPVSCTIQEPTQCSQTPDECVVPAICTSTDEGCVCHCSHGYEGTNCSGRDCSNGIMCKKVSLQAPIGLQFVNDTPQVLNNTIRADFATNRMVSSITCGIIGHPSLERNCSNGNVTFESLLPGKHVLRIVAEDTNGNREVLRRKVTVPFGPESCVVYLINAGVTTADGGNRTSVEFSVSGPVESTICKLDGNSTSCSSPAVFNHLAQGEHKLKIMPEGAQCKGRKIPYTMSFMV